ncbi:MAG: DUF1572 domain-containing protein [Bacteroidota bacterium]
MVKTKLTELFTSRLKEVLTEGKWVIGTNFKDQITDLSWKEAIQKIGPLNSIADLTFHTSYYIAGVADVLEGGALEIRDQYSFDYPPVKSDQDWKGLVNKFGTDSERFINLVQKMSEEKLYQPFVDEQYGNYLRNLDALIEHTYYHFGQVVIIRKMIKSGIKMIFPPL